MTKVEHLIFYFLMGVRAAKVFTYDVNFEKRAKTEFLEWARKEAERRWPQRKKVRVRAWGFRRAEMLATEKVGKEWSWEGSERPFFEKEKGEKEMLLEEYFDKERKMNGLKKREEK